MLPGCPSSCKCRTPIYPARLPFLACRSDSGLPSAKLHFLARRGVPPSYPAASLNSLCAIAPPVCSAAGLSRTPERPRAWSSSSTYYPPILARRGAPPSYLAASLNSLCAIVPPVCPAAGLSHTPEHPRAWSSSSTYYPPSSCAGAGDPSLAKASTSLPRASAPSRQFS